MSEIPGFLSGERVGSGRVLRPRSQGEPVQVTATGRWELVTADESTAAAASLRATVVHCGKLSSVGVDEISVAIGQFSVFLRYLL